MLLEYIFPIPVSTSSYSKDGVGLSWQKRLYSIVVKTVIQPRLPAASSSFRQGGRQNQKRWSCWRSLECTSWLIPESGFGIPKLGRRLVVISESRDLDCWRPSLPFLRHATPLSSCRSDYYFSSFFDAFIFSCCSFNLRASAFFSSCSLSFCSLSCICACFL